MNLGALYYPSPSPLVVGLFDSGVMPLSLGLSAFLEPEAAVKAGSVSTISACDDYAKFSFASLETRVRLVALPLGWVYECGGQVINVING